jgi:3-methyl-2-oxobutanoate hydroxymethyltransferase
VLYDALGFYPKKSPKFSKNFLDGAGSAAEGIQNFVTAVRTRTFPGPEHCL